MKKKLAPLFAVFLTVSSCSHDNTNSEKVNNDGTNKEKAIERISIQDYKASMLRSSQELKINDSSTVPVRWGLPRKLKEDLTLTSVDFGRKPEIQQPRTPSAVLAEKAKQWKLEQKDNKRRHKEFLEKIKAANPGFDESNMGFGSFVRMTPELEAYIDSIEGNKPNIDSLPTLSK